MLDLNAVPIFLAVVEQNSFSGAAKGLGLSKSAVSKRVSALEATLGVKLLHRSTRKLRLTEAGERYVVAAEAAMQSLQEAEAAAGELQSTPQGHLRVHAPMSFGRLHVTPLLPDFLTKHPAMQVHLEMNDTWADMIEGNFDVAIRAGALPDTTLISRKLCDLKSVVCASPDYLKQNDVPVVPQDLSNHNCLTSTHHILEREWHFKKSGKTQTVRISGQLSLNNSDALREALVRGFGIGRLPTFIAGKDISEGRLIPVLSDYEMPTKPLYALYPDKHLLPVKARVFLDYITEAYRGDRPYWDKW
ncbi:LysR family transcriptional regulator [Parvibaculaceae bacterium PLY_AMNH_Bact1]|nr:LysR family transcriptional regulator [Parvibaculaceae bacterium PLY_AMNH_Bact1]